MGPQRDGSLTVVLAGTVDASGYPRCYLRFLNPNSGGSRFEVGLAQIMAL